VQPYLKLLNEIKNIREDKHRRLFCHSVIDGESEFLGFDTWRSFGRFSCPEPELRSDPAWIMQMGRVAGDVMLITPAARPLDQVFRQQIVENFKVLGQNENSFCSATIALRRWLERTFEKNSFFKERNETIFWGLFRLMQI
jgi:hypothetical protein